MTGTKSTSYTPLVTIGYILYGTLVVSVILSTVLPWGQLLASPHVIRYNVILSLVALTVGALLPGVVGYFVGNETIKSKDKLSHHFNGILFGLLAYWVMTIISIFVSVPYDLPQNVRMILTNLVPSLGVAVVSVPIAIAHVRGRQAKHDVIAYKPYGIALVGSIALLLCVMLAIDVHFHGLNWLSGVSVFMTLGIGALSYATLRKSSLDIYSKVCWSAVSVSVISVAMFVASMLSTGVSDYITTTQSMEYQIAGIAIAWVFGLAAWAAYWWRQVRSLSRS